MHRIRKKCVPWHFTKWKSQFRSENGREPQYDDLPGTEEYGRLKAELLKEQGYICCYCEKQIGVENYKKDCDIEHFMPRHPDRKRLSETECAQCETAQLDYFNLFVSCMGQEQYSLDHCNHKKENWYDFRYCVSPVSKEIEGIFGFRTNGKIFAEHNDVRAEQMRKHLNLDTYVLQEQRKAAYDAVCEIEFGGNEDLETDEAYIKETIAFYKEMDERGRYTPFCSMITYCLAHYF